MLFIFFVVPTNKKTFSIPLFVSNFFIIIYSFLLFKKKTSWLFSSLSFIFFYLFFYNLFFLFFSFIFYIIKLIYYLLFYLRNTFLFTTDIICSCSLILVDSYFNTPFKSIFYFFIICFSLSVFLSIFQSLSFSKSFIPYFLCILLKTTTFL